MEDAVTITVESHICKLVPVTKQMRNRNKDRETFIWWTTKSLDEAVSLHKPHFCQETGRIISTPTSPVTNGQVVPFL